MSKEKIGIEIMRMNLQRFLPIKNHKKSFKFLYRDLEFRVDFHEVLFGAFRRIYGKFENENQKPQALEYVKKIEIGSKETIKKIAKKNTKWRNSHGMMDFVMKLMPIFKSPGAVMQSKLMKKSYVNPITKILWAKMVFKAWLSFSKASANSLFPL